ncbi:hypothetical protein [Psychroflexus tropicus]|uniref:hypothetical protein n=1 Tax=Psychroflexus tropicus TaxID=197345 RepID=UPI00035E998C|nr:hypothetical protein [Psychroflexus tropicus]
MKSRLLYIFGLTLVLCSCGTNKFLSSSVPSSEIRQLDYFEPLAYIQLIEKGNRPKLSDSLSTITRQTLDSILETKASKLNLNDKISIENDTLKAQIENELGNLTQMIFEKNNLEGIVLPPVLDSILESRNQRFAMASIATGFGRKKGNYGGQVAKGIGVGILTLGMYVPTPVKSNMTLYTYIFDSERNEVAFYRRMLTNKEKEPTDPEFMEQQLISTFNGYFYEKQ